MNIDGTWHSGWRTIELAANAAENDFLNGSQEWKDAANKVDFDKFVDDNR